MSSYRLQFPIASPFSVDGLWGKMAPLLLLFERDSFPQAVGDDVLVFAVIVYAGEGGST